MKSTMFLLLPLLVGLAGVQGNNNSEGVRGKKYAVQYSIAGNSCDEFHADGSFKSSANGTGTWFELDLILFSGFYVVLPQRGYIDGFSVLGVVVFGVYVSPYPDTQTLIGSQVNSCPANTKPRI